MKCRPCRAWRPPSSSCSSSFYGSPLTVAVHKTTSDRRSYSNSFVKMMPEGPEIKHYIDKLRPAVGQRLVDIRFVSGRYVTKGPPPGFPAFCTTMTRQRDATSADESSATQKPPTDIIQEWNCKGKFLYMILDNGSTSRSELSSSKQQQDPDYQRSIWMTLGMTGRFLSQNEAQQHPHVRWHLELYNTTSHQHTKIYYADVRNFGTLKFCLSRQALLEKLQSLGPDILSSCTQEDFVNVLSNCRPQQNICKILMDQSKISGIGNYILSECLYRASIDPFCSVSELTVEQQTTLFREASHVARESYESQSENDNDKQPFEYQVYGQQVCKQRGESVIRDTNGPHGRTIWYTQSQLFPPLVQRRSLASLAETKGNGQQLQTPLEDPTLPRASRNSVSRRTRSAAATAPTPGNAKLAAILSGSNSDESIPTRLATSSASAATNPTIATRTTKPKQLAQELLLDTITDPDWKSALRDELLDLPSFQSLVEFLEQEQASGATVYPPQKQIFAALNLCPLDEVRVVIVGQDPYHGRGQGHGLAFSVQKGVRAPPSLQNIFKEAVEDVGIETPQHGNLEHWARQGVLLLNTVLTVQEGKALSHKGKGWEQVTDAIIRSLAARNECADSSSLVFLLWGNAAFQKVASAIGKESGHHIIRCSHPSPLGATKTNRPFLGSKCFSRANKALLDMGKDPIDWNVE